MKHAFTKPLWVIIGVLFGAFLNLVLLNVEDNTTAKLGPLHFPANRLLGTNSSKTSDGGHSYGRSTRAFHELLQFQHTNKRTLRELSADLEWLRNCVGAKELVQEQISALWYLDPERFLMDLNTLPVSEQAKILELLSGTVETYQAEAFFAHLEDADLSMAPFNGLLQRWMMADPQAALSVVDRMANPETIEGLRRKFSIYLRFRDPGPKISEETIDQLWSADCSPYLSRSIRGAMTGKVTDSPEVKNALMKRLQNPDTKHTVEFMYFDMTARDDVQTALNEAISSEFQLRVNENLYAIAGIAREFSDQDPLEVLDHIVGKRSRVDYFHLWFRSTKDFKGEKGVIEAIDYAEALNSSENKSSAISAAYSVAAERDPTAALGMALNSTDTMATEFKLSTIWESIGYDDEQRNAAWNEAVSQLSSEDRRQLDELWKQDQ